MQTTTRDKINLNIAVLFIVFNRPENTMRVFDAIRKAKPSRLYVSSDGPRDGNAEDLQNIQTVREIVRDVDWPCDVKYLFNETNLGCQFGPRNGIDWLFSQEECGIILEDDCLPSLSFFYFCQELLEKYHDIDNVMAITGINIANDMGVNGDYYFSRYPLMWGWATWRRAWDKYDPYLSGWEHRKNQGWLLKMDIGGFAFSKVWSKIFDLTKKLGDRATWWDYQWIYSCWVNDGVTAGPALNLIQNLGIGVDVSATHTTNYHPILSNLKLNELSFPLAHPGIIDVNYKMDSFITKHWFYADWFSYIKSTIKLIPGIGRLNDIRIRFFSRKSKLVR